MSPAPPAPSPDAALPAEPVVTVGVTVSLQQEQLRLLLHRAHRGATWQAVLSVPGASGRLAFPSLEALAQWLRRQDRPSCGLR